MLPYIITFILSLLLIYLSLKFKNKMNKIANVFLLVLGIILPCILASFRDISIGTDTNLYVRQFFEVSQNSSNIFNYFYNIKIIFGNTDYLYLLIEFISGNLFHSFQLLLFLCELLVILPIYKSITLVSKKNYDIIFGMFIFYMYIYNMTLNLSRQSISLAFLTLSIAYILKKKNKNDLIKSAISLIIAIFFHKTAAIGILIYFIYLLFYSKTISKKTAAILKIALILFALLFVFNIEPILRFLTNSGIFKHAIEYWYLYKYDNVNIKFATTLWALFLLACLSISKNKNIKIEYSFYKYLLIIDLILIQSGMFLNYIDRIALYFEIPVVFNYFPSLADFYIKNKSNRKTILFISIIVIFIIYWIIWFVIFNNNSTVPYLFKEI
jgi:hypothetical protein